VRLLKQVFLAMWVDNRANCRQTQLI